ncbi:MAG: hypothetical protein V1799_19280 [bacterium]
MRKKLVLRYGRELELLAGPKDPFGESSLGMPSLRDFGPPSG